MIYDVTKGSNTVKIEKDVKAVYPTATIKSSSTDMQHAFRNGIRLNRLLSTAICQKLFEMFRLFYLLHLCFFLHD